MLKKLRERSGSESGFTLIELLVVMLILGILAAIAIPAFLNQKTKASDASAKAHARTALTAMETYVTDNGSSGYTGATPSILKNIEPSLNSSTNLTVTVTDADTAAVRADNATPNPDQTFTITRDGGATTATCTVQGSGGCPNGGNWFGG